MRLLRAYILLLVFAVAAAVITPPDVISQLTAMAGMAIIYSFVILAVSRLRSFQETLGNMRTVIIVLVCLLSITTVYSLVLFQQCHLLKSKQSQHGTAGDQLGTADHQAIPAEEVISQ